MGLIEVRCCILQNRHASSQGEDCLSSQQLLLEVRKSQRSMFIKQFLIFLLGLHYCLCISPQVICLSWAGQCLVEECNIDIDGGYEFYGTTQTNTKSNHVLLIGDL